jgi:hypothetical protein
MFKEAWRSYTSISHKRALSTSESLVARGACVKRILNNTYACLQGDWQTEKHAKTYTHTATLLCPNDWDQRTPDS